jgi:hypothetical protein
VPRSTGEESVRSEIGFPGILRPEQGVACSSRRAPRPPRPARWSAPRSAPRASAAHPRRTPRTRAARASTPGRCAPSADLAPHPQPPAPPAHRPAAAPTTERNQRQHQRPARRSISTAHASITRPRSATPIFSQFRHTRVRLAIRPGQAARAGQACRTVRGQPYSNQPPGRRPPSQRGRRVPRFVIECITPNCHVDIASDGELVTTVTVHPVDSILLSSAAPPHHTTEGAWAP